MWLFKSGLKTHCQSCNDFSTTSNKNEASLDLCKMCNHLLENMALRPDMWQRLARLIGPNHYILHDDFYEDDAYPYAAEINFSQNEYNKYRLQRGESYKNVDDFLNDLLTRFLLIEGEIIIPKEFEQSELEDSLFHEIETKEIVEFHYKCYQILCVLTTSDSIKNFLRKRCDKDKK